MGSRYGGLKQLDPMGPNGEVVLDYSVYDAIRAGFGKVVFIIRRDFEDIFKEKVGSRFAGKIEVDYAFQSLDDLPEGFSVPEGREKPWGTAHALRAARHVVKEPFAVVNADDFYGADAFVQAAKFLTSTTDEPGKAHYGMIGYPLKNTLSDNGDVNRGICSIKDGLLDGVEEFVKIQADEDGVVRGNKNCFAFVFFCVFVKSGAGASAYVFQIFAARHLHFMRLCMPSFKFFGVLCLYFAGQFAFPRAVVNFRKALVAVYRQMV